MACYRLAGQVFRFAFPVPGLELYEAVETEPVVVLSLPVPPILALSCQTVGWIGEEWRAVENWSAPPGILLKVAGGSDFYIASSGQEIVRTDDVGSDSPEITGLDREILLGPALVLALALRGTWCLHASATMFRENVVVFLGESGQGKSTLAAYLSQNASWHLVADDILPVEMDEDGVKLLPHFPQLKLPADAQPGIGLPEQLLLKYVCVLEHVEPDQMPELQKITTVQGVQSLLSHIAGTRMFDAALLANHLEFCAQVARQIPFYKLSYPHRKDALPEIKEILKTLC
jgi:hypothetical protein